MLQIFSDAGVRGNTAALSALIFEDWRTYLACICETRPGISDVTTAESAALELGIRWVLTNRPDCDAITIYTDSLGVGQGLCNYVEDGKVPGRAKSPAWKRLCSLCDRFTSIQFYHVPGHQQILNPNVVCDKLCTIMLDRYRPGGDLCTQSSPLD